MKVVTLSVRETDMYIQINDDWRLAADKYQWMVQKRKKRTDREDEWRAEGYYVDIEKAVAALAERQLRTSEADTLASALAENKRILRELTTALTPAYHITPAEASK